MAYSKTTFKKADSEIKRRRREALFERERRHGEVMKKIPEISELEDAMAKAGLDCVKALGMGEKAPDFIRQLEAVSLDAQRKRRELLKLNGYPEDYLDTPYTCKICGDTGSVNGYACECYKLLLRSVEYERLCSKLPMDKCRFDNFKLDYYPDGAGISPRKRMENVLEYCKAYADDFGKYSPSLLLYGKTGLGKTHLSLAVAGKAAENGFGVIYTSAQNLFNLLEREKFGRSDDAGTEQALLDCDLLIIDDLGAEFSTQFTVSALYNIVNSRELEGRATIISTNLTPEMIKNTYNDRIASRILSNYQILQFDGADIRQIKAN